MPVNTWVKVKWPSNRDVFVNGDYVEAAGTTNTAFQVETGQNTFDLLTESQTIEATVTQTIGPAPKKKPVVVVPLPPPTAPGG